MKRTSVLILFGGESPEHEVSIASTRNVYAALDPKKFSIDLVFIDKKGKWWVLPTLESTIDLTDKAQVAPLLGSRQLVVLPTMTELRPHVILPVLHGRGGEDGSVQGLAQLLHIPIVGCGIAASAIAMDKDITKRLLQASGIPTIPYEAHCKNDPLPSFDRLQKTLGLPLFVKPAGLGSSVGVRRVQTEAELKEALTFAHTYDSKVLIEQAVSGQELEVAALGARDTVEVSGVGEVVPRGEFYDYEAKYSATSDAEIRIPAQVPEAIAEDARLYAQKAFEAIGGSGLARIDFFYANDGMLYLNEINTFPGFTNNSMYPKLWQHRGMSYSQLLERLIMIALEETEK